MNVSENTINKIKIDYIDGTELNFNILFYSNEIELKKISIEEGELKASDILDIKLNYNVGEIEYDYDSKDDKKIDYVINQIVEVLQEIFIKK